MNEDQPAMPRGLDGQVTMPAYRADRSYPPIGLALRPGPVRTRALIFVGIPLALILVFAVIVPAISSAGSADTSYNDSSGQLPGNVFGGDPATTSTAQQPVAPFYASQPSEPTEPPQTSAGEPLFPVGGTSASESETTTSTDDSGPDGVVTQYFAAITSHDYATAWALGGKNIDHSYSDFTAGFADTESDSPTILSVNGDMVSINLLALNTDGSQHTYTGSFTVDGGVITAAHLVATN
ncbi:MAG TPA: hypothetical protein VHX38_20795 [Pseudonocardiaceae bacterium]|jgi:hypothetical protein|nr:hypothetical protein [Pseudonocardiaceae bacterium]